MGKRHPAYILFDASAIKHLFIFVYRIVYMYVSTTMGRVGYLFVSAGQCPLTRGLHGYSIHVMGTLL